MFNRLDAYVMPILLSHLQRYVNIKPEDLKVSIWDGEVSFENLDVKIDVIEKEFNLPFTVVSGKVHEVSFLVPWSRITSEPIVITINTLECVLKLRDTIQRKNSKGSSTNEDVQNENLSNENKQTQTESAPGYLQSLITKIMGNICLDCKNLIFKYVAEDIICSINIRFITVESANEKWEPSFSAILRKIVEISDLTVCLDKINSSGKTESYHDPIVNRCVIKARVLRNEDYGARRYITTSRLDLYLEKLECSCSDEQIKMLSRMIVLLIPYEEEIKRGIDIRYYKAFDSPLADILPQSPTSFRTTNKSSQQASTSKQVTISQQTSTLNVLSRSNSQHLGGTPQTSAENVPENNDRSWSQWVWGGINTVMTSIGFGNDNGLQQQEETEKGIFKGKTLQLALYIDHIIVTFKVSENVLQGYKYQPLLSLELNGCFGEITGHEKEWSNTQCGVSEIKLKPEGSCSCGHPEGTGKKSPPVYLLTGSYTNQHKKGSLFDPENSENLNKKKKFYVSMNYHLMANNEKSLLDKSPAVIIDMVHKMEIPEKFPRFVLEKMEDFEYSNFHEIFLCRVIGGPILISLCSGLLHRTDTLIKVLESCESPKFPKSAAIHIHELQTPTKNDVKTLYNNIPKKTVNILFYNPIIEFHIMDHPKFNASKELLIQKTKYIPETLNYRTQGYPKICIGCKSIKLKLTDPMYPKRLVFTTCKLTKAPNKMLDCCYKNISGKIKGLDSQLVTDKNKKSVVLNPANINLDLRSILYPKLWRNPDIVTEELCIETESIKFTGTKSKLKEIEEIVNRITDMDGDTVRKDRIKKLVLKSETESNDAFGIEIYLEGFKANKIESKSNVTYNGSLNFINVHVFKPENAKELENNVLSSLRESIKSPNQKLNPLTFDIGKIQLVVDPAFLS